MGNEDERPSIWISDDTKKKYIKDERCIIDVDSVQYIYQWEMEWL